MYYTIYMCVCQYIKYDFPLTVYIMAMCMYWGRQPVVSHRCASKTVVSHRRDSKPADCAYAADLYISGETKPLTLHRCTIGADRERQPPSSS